MTYDQLRTSLSMSEDAIKDALKVCLLLSKQPEDRPTLDDILGLPFTRAHLQAFIPTSARCSRAAAEMQPRCSRDVAEMQPRCSRDAAERQPRCSRDVPRLVELCEEGAAQ